MKKFCILLLIVLIAAAGVGLWGFNKLQQSLEQPISVQKDQLFTLEKGTNGKKLTALLAEQQILPKSTLLEKSLPWVIKFDPKYSQIKAGTYDISAVKNTADLLKLFNSGKEVQFALRFTDGETVKQVLKSLENAPHLENTLKEKNPKEIITLLGLPETTSLEGWIYPDTYNYTPNSTDVALLKRATDRMQKTLDMAWQQRDKDVPLKKPYEMLILASIVEKETALDSERGKVASVFVNRLKTGMKLQTDPTVIYGMGDDYKGNIRKKDLETPTAYNTYVIDGLPPTPIAMPSEKSLMAVAKPEKTAFMYFVADGSGGHKFSKTLDEHNRAVQDYLRWYRSQKKK
ncbi:UPF0755 protein [Cricetibacter osteomyelitidis]|uniref:Endolytic murein transglycosylase n=1 Tax=Cricetibacter osteomyelitidis TaxID=1521931 RepID=A0A4R2T3Q3_9PAST|nr:endolytic transglycosylase MltG [Cricetibacter osteomyelitidis]TCP96910.1 UPF0755 protein [Cricetibacter osteomyelitidis]